MASEDVNTEKIKEFADKYPRSRFLETMLPPVRDVQASKIDEYFAKEKLAKGVAGTKKSSKK